jgi:hypothetical protein
LYKLSAQLLQDRHFFVPTFQQPQHQRNWKDRDGWLFETYYRYSTKRWSPVLTGNPIAKSLPQPMTNDINAAIIISKRSDLNLTELFMHRVSFYHEEHLTVKLT